MSDHLFQGNRFKERHDAPPCAIYEGRLVACIPFKKEHPDGVIFLFSFEHGDREYRAGIALNGTMYNDEALRLIAALGVRPELGTRARTSQLLGRKLRIHVAPKFSEGLQLWYLAVQSYEKASS